MRHDIPNMSIFSLVTESQNSSAVTSSPRSITLKPAELSRARASDYFSGQFFGMLSSIYYNLTVHDNVFYTFARAGKELTFLTASSNLSTFISRTNFLKNIG